MEDDEVDMLDLAFEVTETSRLGCQIKVRKDMAGMKVRAWHRPAMLQGAIFFVLDCFGLTVLTLIVGCAARFASRTTAFERSTGAVGTTNGPLSSIRRPELSRWFRLPSFHNAR
jgi:hypothetical protein